LGSIALCAGGLGVLLAGCVSAPPKLATGHLQTEAADKGKIPELVEQPVPLPPPRPTARPETYSVVVNNIRVQDLLFSLARDAKINIDVHPGISGTVTLNAIDQTLDQLLARISKQVDMRYEIDNGTLVVLPDSPYLRTYHLDYLLMARDAINTVAISTQLQTTGGAGTGSGAGSASTGGGNNSTTRVTNTSKNDFWKTIEKNVKDILAETDKERIISRRGAAVQDQAAADATATAQPAAGAPPAGGAAPAAPAAAAAGPDRNADKNDKEYETLFAATVIVNPESGILTVRATERQHAKIQEFLDQVMANATRQVLIEVTVAEVDLNQNYQQGINWSRFAQGVSASGITAGTSTSSQPGNGGSFTMTPIGSPPGTPTQGLLSIGYLNPTSRIGSIAASIQLLESFGNVKVLSSPKISVLNNQTALLKVVDNIVYFTISAQTVIGTATSTGGSLGLTTYTSTVNSVPVGFVMQVTPQIADNDIVMINLRPTVSRITAYVNDPNPNLAQANVISRIPQIQSREMESVLRIPSGETAVMGGLMQDGINNNNDTVPLLASLPLVGSLFQNHNDITTKTELVIFLRPVVIHDASLEGDYRNYKSLLPDSNFLKRQIGPKLPVDPLTGAHQ
jgi:MSHA type pilus biogenesis protein MshL